jgi:hypothetical protein
MLNLTNIAALHDQLTIRWHREAFETWRPASDSSNPEQVWTGLVSLQHLANFELWHTEDAARTPEATDGDLARVKRHIDETNQRRNDLAEKIDEFLLETLSPAGLPDLHAPLHSESPGLMIDRLSILALKIFHTLEEAERHDASPSHIERNLDRLHILRTQRSDLAGCLNDLWQQTLDGARRFKLYRQLKMYNDPALNPAVYRHASGN